VLRREVGAWLPDTSSWYNVEVHRVASMTSRVPIDPMIAVERGWADGRWARAEFWDGWLLTVRTATGAPADTTRTVAFPPGDALASVLRDVAERALALECPRTGRPGRR
jgi:hypothetical protein